MTKIKPEEVIMLGRAMVDYDYSITELSRNYLIPKTTVWRCITFNLKYDDDDLFVQCKNILRRHKKEGWKKRLDRGCNR